jgi:hypothetical protein
MPEQKMGPRLRISRKAASQLQGDGTGIGFAMDPESGAVLLTGGNISSMLVGAQPRNRAPAKMPFRNAGIVLAPAGKNRFHALATSIENFNNHPPLYYLEYSDGAWSAPIPIGQYAYHFFATTFGPRVHPTEPRNDAFRIVSGDDGRALLIWPHEDALVARWLTLK